MRIIIGYRIENGFRIPVSGIPKIIRYKIGCIATQRNGFVPCS